MITRGAVGDYGAEGCELYQRAVRRGSKDMDYSVQRRVGLFESVRGQGVPLLGEMDFLVYVGRVNVFVDFLC